MSSCSIKYIRAKLFILSSDSAIVLFSSPSGAQSLSTVGAMADPRLCILMSGICFLIELCLIN